MAQFNEWMALAHIDGWGEENERIKYWSCFIVSSLHNALMIAAAKRGSKIERSDMLTVQQLLKRNPKRQRGLDRDTQNAAIAASLKSMCGF